MAAAPPASRLPRWLVVASWPIGGIALTAFFVFLGFPYDLLAVRLTEQVEQSTDVRLRIGELSPHVGFAGLGLEAREVLAAREGGRSIVLQRLIVRPAWSFAWLRGMPAVHLDVTSEIGSGAGTLILGSAGGFAGSLEAVRLEYLPLEMLDSFDFQGILDAVVDLHASDGDEGDEPGGGGGLVGDVDFDLREGSLSTEGLPVAVPFDRLHGQLHFGGERYLTVSGVRLDGPLIAGTVEGEIGHGASADRRPLKIDIAYQIQDANLGSMLSGLGTRGKDGISHLSVTGTLARPVVR